MHVPLFSGSEYSWTQADTVGDGPNSGDFVGLGPKKSLSKVAGKSLVCTGALGPTPLFTASYGMDGDSTLKFPNRADRTQIRIPSFS